MGLRRTSSQRTIGASSTRNASSAVVAPQADDDIFCTPANPTKAYPNGPARGIPKSSWTSSWPTVKDDPGVTWSMPAGSKSTFSNAQRIGQSTLQTSLPSFWVARLVMSVYPQVEEYVRSVVASSYAVTVVVSRWHAAVRLVGEAGQLVSPSASSSSATLVGQRLGLLVGAAALVTGFFVRCRARTASTHRVPAAGRTCSR